jgi:uncharacterized membrane protein YhaH (DUF805 family)
MTRPHFFCMSLCLLICVFTLTHLRFRLGISLASVQLYTLYLILLFPQALIMLVA